MKPKLPSIIEIPPNWLIEENKNKEPMVIKYIKEMNEELSYYQNKYMEANSFKDLNSDFLWEFKKKIDEWYQSIKLMNFCANLGTYNIHITNYLIKIHNTLWEWNQNFIWLK